MVDNGGGGIFSFLPQGALPPERFELLFGTPPAAGVAAVAEAYGVPAERVERAADVAPALEAALAAGGVRVLVVPTGDRTADVRRITERLLRHLETFIREHPDQWHLPHRIWEDGP